MNSRARRLRRERRRYRNRVTHLVCTAGRSIPEALHWDFGTDVLTWGSSRIPLQVVRDRRWPWYTERPPLTEDAKRRLAAFMGPHLDGGILRPRHPSWDERYDRKLEP